MIPAALVADDDAALRGLMAEVVRAEGFAVEEHADGSTVIAALEARAARGQAPVALIVSDVHMPGATGIAVVQAVRRLGLAVPVILVTAFEDEATHRAAHGLGCAAVLDKPFDLADLRAAVRRALLSSEPGDA